MTYTQNLLNGGLILFSALLCFLLQGTPAKAGQLGANAIYLMSSYGTVPEGDDAYRFVRRQMAKKAIRDARAAGLTFVRVGLTGFRPINFEDNINDLAVWQQDPNRFWAAAEEMFDDLDQAGIRLVPTLAWSIIQFPALGGDDLLTFLRDPDCKSRVLLTRFVTDFVTRYKNRPTILFYEMSNEWNLFSDRFPHPDGRVIDVLVDGSIWFAGGAAGRVYFSCDVSRQVGGQRVVHRGVRWPRTAATHLRSGAGWIADSRDEFKQYLLYINEPFDIVGVHIYPPTVARRKLRRKGVAPVSSVLWVS
jgi:hypothetical protein